MDPQSTPTITSFVIRFVLSPTGSSRVSVQEDHPAAVDFIQRRDGSYRGSIRHIQTEQELSFSSWQEAVAFIQRYVPLEEWSAPAAGPDAQA